MQTIEEENSGEDDLLAEVKNDSGNVSRSDITKRLKEINGNKEFAEEAKVLQTYLGSLEQETELNGKNKEAELDLDEKLLHKYKGLSEQEIKLLVIVDKWLKFMHDSIQNELDRISQRLSGRIKELAQRYDKPLPELDEDMKNLAITVENHMRKMGFQW